MLLCAESSLEGKDGTFPKSHILPPARFTRTKGNGEGQALLVFTGHPGLPRKGQEHTKEAQSGTRWSPTFLSPQQILVREYGRFGFPPLGALFPALSPGHLLALWGSPGWTRGAAALCVPEAPQLCLSLGGCVHLFGELRTTFCKQGAAWKAEHSGLASKAVIRITVNLRLGSALGLTGDTLLPFPSASPRLLRQALLLIA